MKEHEISTPEELEAAVVKGKLDKQRRLWRAVEGRYSSAAIVGLICGAGLILVGIFADSEDGISRAFSIGLGVYLFCQFQIYLAQAKSEAMAELLKRLERRVTMLEKNVHG